MNEHRRQYMRTYLKKWMREDYRRDPSRQKAAARRYYLKNRKQILARDQEKLRICAEIIKEAKSRPCTDCHQKYPHYVMDLHHARGVKIVALSRYARFRHNIPRLLEEIAKCDVVCSNCHRIRTFKHGLKIASRKGKETQ